MSGAGRKHRAKHLTKQYLDVNGWNGPAEGQHLAICLEAPHGQHVRVLQLGDTDETNAQALVHVPRKFHKVIWLRVKDVVIVHDGDLALKPSPEQLELFLDANPAWRDRVDEAKRTADGLTRTIERQPLFQQSKGTTTSVLPTRETSGVVEHDPLAAFSNPNRQNIRHRQQFFFGVEEENGEEEEDEEGEEEGVEMEQEGQS